MTSLSKRINELVTDEGWSRKEATTLAQAELGTSSKLTPAQASALEMLEDGQAHSAGDFNRHALDALVNKGLAVKHTVGRAVTYTMARYESQK